ncbi:MAG: VOC family protein [Saprospiraceae bacterium]|nr:VOC family protein [Saprospiraceae bacterium]
MDYVISGIQQLGVGVADTDQAWKWYNRHFGMDVPIFEERAPAPLMTKYTGGEIRNRYAILALNMQGGGGFEIWQYTCRTPVAPAAKPRLGDYGIFAGKIKSRNVEDNYNWLKSQGVTILSPVTENPNGEKYFFVEDPYGNPFQIVEANNWFQKKSAFTGGVYGAMIGVSDIEKSLPLYRDILGYDQIIFDDTATIPNWSKLEGGEQKIRRVLLRHQKERSGAFAPLLGHTEIELIQSVDSKGKVIFKDRFWGDLGFIHLCFDIRNMDSLRQKCTEMGYPFTIDSNESFDMGEAAGRFTYIEDADGTLIEFVETHKVPIAKKWGWYLNLKNRPPQKPLPRWLLKGLGLNRKKIS